MTCCGTPVRLKRGLRAIEPIPKTVVDGSAEGADGAFDLRALSGVGKYDLTLFTLDARSSDCRDSERDSGADASAGAPAEAADRVYSGLRKEAVGKLA